LKIYSSFLLRVHFYLTSASTSGGFGLNLFVLHGADLKRI